MKLTPPCEGQVVALNVIRLFTCAIAAANDYSFPVVSIGTHRRGGGWCLLFFVFYVFFCGCRDTAVSVVGLGVLREKISSAFLSAGRRYRRTNWGPGGTLFSHQQSHMDLLMATWEWYTYGHAMFSWCFLSMSRWGGGGGHWCVPHESNN